MLTLELLSFSIFIIYLICVITYVRHIPESLSETYYLLGDRNYRVNEGQQEVSFKRLKASIFTGMMWIIAILLMIPLLEITPELGKPLAFLSLAAIMFVGAAPQFHDEMEGKVHTTSAYIAAALGIAWSILFAHGLWCLIGSFVVSLILALITKTVKYSKIFWLEMVAFGTVYLSAILLNF